MSSSPHQPPPRPTLEDLLRFKRAERPAPEFWEEFDRGLRQKQLTALMQRPQGWARVRPVLFRGMRWAVPATAAAAVALVVLQIPRVTNSLRETQVAAAPRPLPLAEHPAALPVVQVAEELPLPPQEELSQVATVVAVLHSEEPMPEPAQVSMVEPSERSLPWAAASLAYSQSSGYRSGELYPIRTAARETRRPNSSWTSRFSEMVRDISAEQADARVMQLVSMNLLDTNQYGASSGSAVGSQLVASSNRSGRGLSDREFRDLDARLGAKGSTFSIKF